MTAQELITHLKFLSGHTSLSDADAVRLLNFAKKDYSYLALTSSGRWKFDDTTHKDSNNDKTFPIATATLKADTNSIPLATNMIMINQVLLEVDGDDEVLEPIDVRDSKENALRTVYKTAGQPKKYDYDAHSIFFYPASDVDRTVTVLYSRAANDFTTSDLTQESGIPAVHELYLVHHSMRQLGFRTTDNNKVDIEREVQKWEGIDGQNGKIADWYSKRDQDTPQRLTALIGSAFRGRSRP